MLQKYKQKGEEPNDDQQDAPLKPRNREKEKGVTLTLGRWSDFLGRGGPAVRVKLNMQTLAEMLPSRVARRDAPSLPSSLFL